VETTLEFIKKKRKKIKVNLFKIKISFYLYTINFYDLDCVGRTCSWSLRNNKEKEHLKILRQKFKNFKTFEFFQ